MKSDDLKQKVLCYCSHRERTEAEVTRKLEALGADDALKQHLLAYVKQAGFINPRRFVETFVHSKLKARWGWHKIAHALSQKGVSHTWIAWGRSLMEASDYQRGLLSLARQKNAMLSAYTPESRFEKLSRFLLQRGYAFESVQAAAANVIFEKTDNDPKTHS